MPRNQIPYKEYIPATMLFRLLIPYLTFIYYKAVVWLIYETTNPSYFWAERLIAILNEGAREKWVTNGLRQNRESFIGDAEENKKLRLVKQITVLSELEMKYYKKCHYMSSKFIFRRMSGENKERRERRKEEGKKERTRKDKSKGNEKKEIKKEIHVGRHVGTDEGR